MSEMSRGLEMAEQNSRGLLNLMVGLESRMESLFVSGEIGTKPFSAITEALGAN